MSVSTPFAIRLAERILSEEHHCLIGDLEWTWRTWREERGSAGAMLWLWGTLFTLVPRLLLRDLIWQHAMLRNYLNIALRQINKFRAFSAINVFGLALSMSVCLLIVTMVRDYRSFENFHPDADRLYRVTTEQVTPWGQSRMATSSLMVADQLQADSEAIETVVRMRRSSGKLTLANGFVDHFSGLYAEPAFFEVFGFELSQGNQQQALHGPMKMVLSRQYADRLFPDQEPVGQLIERESGLYEVTGIVAEPEGRSQLKFDALISFDSLPLVLSAPPATATEEWNLNTAYYTYLKMADGASIEAVEQLLSTYARQFVVGPEALPTQYFVQPIEEINLGRVHANEIGPMIPGRVVFILSMLGLVLIGTAIFNYMNLTVSRSLRRSEELGVRKVMGAHRRQLVQQFITESIVTSVLALGLSILFLKWLIPKFNSLGTIGEEGMGVTISVVDPMLLLLFLGFAIMVGIVGGLLPAWRVSRVSPIAAFKGSSGNQLGGRFWGRKALVVFQFSLSVVAIITVTTLLRQMDYLSNADLNLNESELVNLRLSGVEFEPLANELRTIPGIRSVGATSSIPSSSSLTQADIRTADMEKPAIIQSFAVDASFTEQHDLAIVAGRGFDEARASDQGTTILLTEKAITFLGFESPEDAIGREIVFDEDRLGDRVEVIGVVSDFYSRGFEVGFVPVAMTYEPKLYQYAMLQLAAGNQGETIRAMEEVWARHAPGMAASWSFLDDTIQAKVNQGRADTKIVGLFGFLIVVIACLGLLGMAMFTAETRLKEVGVRKTLGADTRQVVWMLSKDYLRLIVVAILISAPLAWWMNDMILSNYANRIAVGPSIMLMGILPIVGIALFTVGSQTLRAALSNPVDVMRAE